MDFDPENDVRVSPDGLLEWASDRAELHDALKEYFRIRNEEGKNAIFSLISDELAGNKTVFNPAPVSRSVSRGWIIKRALRKAAALLRRRRP
jgi:hypothetical protein